MPLSLFVHSLLRIRTPPDITDNQPHPLHAFIESLLSLRSATNTYHNELPNTLADGSGPGDAEESLMWYTLGYEKANAGSKQSTPTCAHLAGEGSVTDAKAPAATVKHIIEPPIPSPSPNPTQCQLITLAAATPVKKVPNQTINSELVSYTHGQGFEVTLHRERSSIPYTAGSFSSHPTAWNSSLTLLGTGDKLPLVSVLLFDLIDSPVNTKDEDKGSNEIWLPKLFARYVMLLLGKRGWTASAKKRVPSAASEVDTAISEGIRLGR
ncbi:hypothetical protein DFH29DRAFT_1069587 [Suillus ampliporus]|nr:hypothetical protein DFH29DRAFT_1069587 [Suillus ampliporus]